jgi:hypothetical protein
MILTPKERELLQGMVNCHRVCRENFEETVRMVGSARGLTSQEVKEILERLKRADGEEYNALRSQLPDDFPL